MSDDEGQKKKTGLFSKHLQETLQVFRLEGCSTVDGKLDKEAFMRCLARTELGKNATKETLEMLFDVFDADNSGSVSVEEFMLGLSVASEGTFEEKAGLVFRSIDKDNDGFLTRDELEDRLTQMYALNNKKETRDILRTSGNISHTDFSNLAFMYNFVSNPRAHEMCLNAITEGKIGKAMTSIFKSADLDNDGRISESEWISAAGKNDDIKEMLTTTFNSAPSS